MNRLTALPSVPALHVYAPNTGKLAQSVLPRAGPTGQIAARFRPFGEHFGFVSKAVVKGRMNRDPDRDLLDSAARHIAQLAPPTPPIPLASTTEGRQPGPNPISVEELWPTLVRKAAWSGDARCGTVRLELGAGALAGAVVMVHANNGRVCVKLTAPRGVDVDAWRARISARLVVRGFDVEAVDVD
jgi:hypothetical protein